MTKLKQRIITGVILLALVALVLALRGPVAMVFCAALMIAAQYEVCQALKKRDLSPYFWVICAVSLPAIALVPFYGMPVGLCALCVLLLGACALLLLSPKYAFSRILATCFVAIYPTICFFALMALFTGDSFAFFCLCCAIFVPVGCDTLAYFVGSAIGKHKLCPHLSPKKSVEGAIAGFFGAALVMTGLKFLAPQFGCEVSWLFVAVAALFCGAFAQLGDLFESSVKRFVGIKDMSNLLPGHGGIMDRLDSVGFAAIVMWCMHYLFSLPL